MKYTQEMFERIEQLRKIGLSWDEVASQIGGASGHSMRNNYRYHITHDTHPTTGMSMIRSIGFVPDEYDNISSVEMLEEKPSNDNKALLKARKSATEHRKVTQKLLMKEIALDDVVEAIRGAVAGIKPTFSKKEVAVPASVTGRHLTFEVLFSDSQIGKLIKDDHETYYDTTIAKSRINYFADVVIKEIKKKLELGYIADEIIVAFLGDIIESDAKHETSYYGVDSSTSEQVSVAISSLFNLFLRKFYDLGIPVHVIGIAGNHDWDRKGMSTTRPGRTMLTYPIYVALEEITKACKLDHVTFNIPAGTYGVRRIYNQTAIYEHGYQLNNIQPVNLNTLKQRRAAQLKQHVDFFRVGDKHQQFMLDNGNTVVNGAMFSDMQGLEYSGDKGFSSAPGQYMIIHTPRDDARNSIYTVMQVQLAHVR